MTTRKKQLGICALLAWALGFAGGPARAQDEAVNWLGDYQEGVQEAKQTGKPLLVEFRCEA
jgi:GMP synthase-like glutamine amidotransferase